ncbi:MAG: ATP-binding protein [Fusobacteriota bacterium]
MRSIADHIQDIAYNSIKGNADNIDLILDFNDKKKTFSFKIIDDGDGIPEDKLKHIFDPFYTTRNKKVRKVGMGLPLLKQNSELTGGHVDIKSKVDKGTTLFCKFNTNNIDMLEFGNVPSTIVSLITADDNINWNIQIIHNGKKDSISTKDLKDILGSDISLSHVKVIPILKNIFKDMFDALDLNLE